MPAVIVPACSVKAVRAADLVPLVEQLLNTGTARSLVLYDDDRPIVEIPLRVGATESRFVHPLTLVQSLSLLGMDFMVEVIEEARDLAGPA